MVKIDLVLNNVCNFRCSYCCGGLTDYQSNDTLEPVNIARLIYYLNLNSNLTNLINFNILGGEPLLYPYLDKVYNILAKCKIRSHINLDTNGSIDISENIIHAIISCYNQSLISLNIYLTYHYETLNIKPLYLRCFLNNIKLLLEYKIPVGVKLLYNNENYKTMKNIQFDLLEKYPNIMIDWQRTYNFKQKPIFLHDYFCYANNYFGFFPGNKLFYNCEYENDEKNVTSYAITKDNLLKFIQNINIKRKMLECRSLYSCPSKIYLNKNKNMRYYK